MTSMNKEEQKKIIIKKLEENYWFGCITDFISMDEFLGENYTYSENVWRLQNYISEELLKESAEQVADRIGNRLGELMTDIQLDKFEEKMNEGVEE